MYPSGSRTSARVVLALLTLWACPSVAQTLAWETMDAGTVVSLNAVWDRYAVGEAGTILHLGDDDAWTVDHSGGATNLLNVWGTGKGVYAVGDNGTVLNLRAGSWFELESGSTEFLRGIWGTGTNNVFIAGTRGTLLHYNGVQISPEDAHTGQRLYGVWGSSDHDVWVAGNRGTILHYDGAAWTEQTRVTTLTLFDVWVRSTSEAYAVGAQGTVLKFDGASWKFQTVPTVEGLTRVRGLGDTMFIVGAAGTILTRDGGGWVKVDAPTSASLRGLAVSATSVTIVGENGLVMRASLVPEKTPAPVREVLRISPNPFAGETAFSFRLEAPADVAFDVYDVRGAVVWSIPARHFPAGPAMVPWRAVNADGLLPAGVYFVRMRAGDYSETRKLTIVR